MDQIRERLHAKRGATEARIRQLEREGRAGTRYTAMMPDIPFLVLGLICDAGWLIHLIAGVLFFLNHGLHGLWDWLALAALAGIVLGIACTVYLNKIHEKEIATRAQKNMSFGLTVFAGLAGGIVGFLQIASAGFLPALIWMTAGGLVNFAAGLPIWLSFQKGIVYGVR